MQLQNNHFERLVVFTYFVSSGLLSNVLISRGIYQICDVSVSAQNGELLTSPAFQIPNIDVKTRGQQSRSKHFLLSVLHLLYEHQ